MKIIRPLLLALTLGLMSFSAIAPVQSIVENNVVAAAGISWKAETIDVGQIPQNVPKAIDFEFKNTGKTAVVITSVQGSCGCTATNYTKEPILPGKSAKITATYNAANKGAFSKTVTVVTSAEATPKVLTLKGIVL